MMTIPGAAMIDTYDYRLVVLSVLIAMVASFAALDLSGRVNSSHGRRVTFGSRAEPSRWA